MLKKQPERPIVKGSRVKYQNKLNNPNADKEEEKKDESAEESEPEEENPPSPPPPTTKTTKTSTASISSLKSTSNNDVDTSTNKTFKSRYGDNNEREEKKDTSTPVVVKTTVGVGINSRFPKRDPEPEPAATKPIGSRYGASTRGDRITSVFDKRSTSTTNTDENTTPSTRVPFRTTPSRLRDEKDDSDTNSSSIANRYRPKKTTDDNNSWRTPRKKEV